MNRLDFIIFLVIYMTVVGLVCAMFGAGTFSQPFQSQESELKEYGQKDPSIWDTIFGGLTAIADALSFFFKFIVSILIFDVPGVPLILRGIMVTPIYVVSFILLADYIRGISST